MRQSIILLIFSFSITACTKDPNVPPPAPFVYTGYWVVDGDSSSADHWGFRYGDIRNHTKILHDDFKGNYLKELNLLFPKGEWYDVMPPNGEKKSFLVTDTPRTINEVSITVGISIGNIPMRYYGSINEGKMLEVYIDTNGRFHQRFENVTVRDSTTTKKVTMSKRYW